MTGLFDRLVARSDDRLSDADFVQARRPSRFENDGWPVSSRGLDGVDEPVETRAEGGPASSPLRRTGSSAFASPARAEAMEGGGETATSAGPPSEEDPNAMAGSGRSRIAPATGPVTVDVPADRLTNGSSPAGLVSADTRSAQQSNREPDPEPPTFSVETSGRSKRSAESVVAGSHDSPPGPRVATRAIDRFEPIVMSVVRPPDGEESAESPPASPLDSRRPSSVSIRIGRIDVRAAPAAAPRPAPGPAGRRGSPLTDYLGWKGR
jgi:hypothetical protein